MLYKYRNVKLKEREVFFLYMANLVLKNNTSGGKTSVTADNFVGNASTASKWLTARTLTLSGAVTGSASIDGSGNVTLTSKIREIALTDGFQTSFRTQIKGDANNGPFLAIIRSEAAISGYASAYGSGIGFGRQDTHGYIYLDYSTANGFIGAGSSNKLNWVKKLVFADGTGATGTWNIGISGNAETSNKLKAHTTLTSATVDSFLEASTLKWACADASVTGNDGVIMSIGWSANYGVQLWFDDGSAEGGMKFRNRKDESTWNPWRQTLTENNYTSYTVTKTGSGASGTWGISISGNAATATAASNTANVAIRRSITGSNHAEALKSEFNSYKASIPRNTLSTYYSTAYGNGSFYMGYFLSGYDTAPYGGFFVAHYNDPYYVGIANGGFSQQSILTSSNYSSYCAPASHSHSYVPLSGGTMTGKLQVNHTIFSYQYTNSNNRAAFMWDKPGSNYTGVGACAQADMIHFGPCDANANWVAGYNQIWRFQGGVYATGWLESDNCGTGAPGSSTPGYGRVGALYFKY